LLPTNGKNQRQRAHGTISAVNVPRNLAGGQVDEFTSAEQALVAQHDVTRTICADDLHRRTPCPEWDVRALAEHLIDTIARLGAAAGLSTTVPSSGFIAERIQEVTRPILADWRRRGLEGHIDFGGRPIPAHLALGILSLELVVHGWDFAMALDRRIDIADEHAAYVHGLARQTLTTESRAINGFGPAVEVPAGANALDRLIAFTGRDPRQQEWR
jgi:uncharacterized protein (TIGR03086 family)